MKLAGMVSGWPEPDQEKKFRLSEKRREAREAKARRIVPLPRHASQIHQPFQNIKYIRDVCV